MLQGCGNASSPQKLSPLRRVPPPGGTGFEYWQALGSASGPQKLSLERGCKATKGTPFERWNALEGPRALKRCRMAPCTRVTGTLFERPKALETLRALKSCPPWACRSLQPGPGWRPGPHRPGWRRRCCPEGVWRGRCAATQAAGKVESYAQDFLDGTGVLAPVNGPCLKEAGNAPDQLLTVAACNSCGACSTTYRLTSCQAAVPPRGPGPLGKDDGWLSLSCACRGFEGSQGRQLPRPALSLSAPLRS